MPQFELRYLNKFEVPVIIREYTAQDDVEALMEAERHCKNYDIEVWHGDWRVARVKDGNALLMPEDRQAL